MKRLQGFILGLVVFATIAIIGMNAATVELQDIKEGTKVIYSVFGQDFEYIVK